MKCVRRTVYFLTPWMLNSAICVVLNVSHFLVIADSEFEGTASQTSVCSMISWISYNIPIFCLLADKLLNSLRETVVHRIFYIYFYDS